MHKFFGYVRVSTTKQGEHGVSLQEQRHAIVNYAQRHGLSIVAWFEEQETAAKRGRVVFDGMLKLLRKGEVRGVVIHKIDRSARNLKDWADLGELIDAGVDIHFANESLDLHTRGGRLSADIQAVVAADFIRNLREETRKGFYGRIKQGFYPLKAPLGYIDCGKAQFKKIDPVIGPLVRLAFDLYSTGKYSFDSLLPELARRGLKNHRGGALTRNGLSTVFDNPFYIGLIRLRKTGEVFPGGHTTLVSKITFDRVQAVKSGKTNTRVNRNDFIFRRLLSCGNCKYSLIGERQKGKVYYRCHTPSCATTCIKEELIDDQIRNLFKRVSFTHAEQQLLAEIAEELQGNWGKRKEEDIQSAKLIASRIDNRLSRLTDAFIDGSIDKVAFETRKAELLLERQGIAERLESSKQQNPGEQDKVKKFLELATSALLSYETGFPEEKRELVKILTSNRTVTQKKVELEPSIPFSEVLKRSNNAYCDQQRDTPRTFRELYEKLIEISKVGQLPNLPS